MSIELIDETELLDQVEGDEEFLLGLIDTFLEQCGPDLEEVLNAASRRDAEALYRSAHKMKGTLNIFSSAAASPALALEMMGRERNLDGLEAALVHLQETIAALKTSLLALRDKYARISDGA
jgi:HPt (histidine-containing phosphotransfer) domain-containing protein